jgi:sulfhydrogenase subunit beta (sulfur reductase)
MTLVTIDKKNWAEGLTAAADTYRLFGPVSEKDFHQFKALEKGEMPDLEMVNTRLSPKAMLFPSPKRCSNIPWTNPGKTTTS